MNGKTNQMAIFFHALVFFLVYSLIARAMGLVLTKTDLIVTTSLFLALSPGLLLTLPPRLGWRLPFWSDQHSRCPDSRDRLRRSFCAFYASNFLNSTK